MKKAVLRVLVCGSISCGILFADSNKIAKDLKGPNVSGPVKVIVQRKSLLLGGTLQVVGRTLKALPLIGAALEQIDASGLAALSDDPDVTYITPDRSVGSTFDHYEYAVNAPDA